MRGEKKKEAKRPNFARMERLKMVKQMAERANSAREAPSIKMPMHSLPHLMPG